MTNQAQVDYFFTRDSFKNMRGGDWPLVVASYSNEETLGGTHYHDFFELAVITGGYGTYLDGEGQKYELVPGQVFLMRPGMIHNYIEQRNLMVTNVLWLPDAFDMPLHDLVSSPGYHALFELEPQTRAQHRMSGGLVLDTGPLAEVTNVLRRLQRELSERPPGAWFMALCLLGELFTMLCRNYASSDNRRSSELLKLDRALAYMNQHYGEPIRRDQLAKLAGMSETNFFRHFKRALNRAPSEYLAEIRLMRARELLLSSGLGLSEIAVKCGFSDGNHFGVCFKKQFGISPHQYRLKN